MLRRIIGWVDMLMLSYRHSLGAHFIFFTKWWPGKRHNGSFKLSLSSLSCLFSSQRSQVSKNSINAPMVLSPSPNLEMLSRWVIPLVSNYLSK